MDVDCSQFLSEASRWLPDRPIPVAPEAGHIPFVQWLVQSLRPRLVVGIGPDPGCIDYALSDALRRSGLAACSQFIRVSSAAVSGLEKAPAPPHRHHALDPQDFESRLGPVLDSPASAFPHFEARSIDILHLAGPKACGAIADTRPDWLSRISPTGIVLLTGIAVQEPQSSARQMFRTLQQIYPSFEFTHDHGLGIIAVGDRIPQTLRQFLEAGGRVPTGDEIRSWYQRLGEGVRDHLARIELERSSRRTEIALSDSLASQTPIGMLREQNASLLEALWSCEEDRRAMEQDVHDLTRDNRALEERARQLEHARHTLVQELNQVQQSLGWTALQKLRRLRRAMIRDDGFSGRCWRASKRRVRSILSSSPHAAVRRAISRARRLLPFTAILRREAAGLPLSHLAHEAARGLRFEDLKWSYTGNGRRNRSAEQGCFKILLVSHSACRTGAPHCLLRLAEQLAELPQFECWIVLQKEGELQEEFARIAPTMDIARLVEMGISGTDAPAVIAALFRRYTSRGIAVCNTMAVSNLHAAFVEFDVPVLSWVHELPTMVHINGGDEAAERVRKASRRIIVPADAVRDAWLRRFAIEPEKILTLRYGVDPRSKTIDRQRMRVRVRKELGIPEHDFIVLACGTVDLRKGADLFIQVARRLFTRDEACDVASRTWFVWVGEAQSGGLAPWLAHDAEVAGYKNRVIFTGQKPDTTPYFGAADVFLLTSREDPCPFANLEAMECGLPVVVFEDAGGAPGVIGKGGITIPYLDVEAMTSALVKLLQDPRLRSEMGHVGQEIIHRDFTWSGFMTSLQQILRDSYGVYPPRTQRVSVIVPNYRHAPFLEARLTSIFRQTVHPHEIIVLDDASPDDSIPVIERLMAASPFPIRLIRNQVNSGSTFRQWIKGLEAASGDLIWIAESDDSCHPQFLERLLPAFHDPEVVLAYSQSELIGADDAQIEPHFLGHTDDLSPGRWRNPYCVSGAVEIEEALSQKNTIPNASAMLFRRPVGLEFAEELFGLKFAGDWLFHAMHCREGKVAYVPDVLNSYRRHEQTVSHRAVRAETYLRETLYVKRRVFESSPVSAQAMARSVAQTVFEYHRLNPGDEPCPVSAHLLPEVQAEIASVRTLIAERAGARSSLRVLLVFDSLSSSLSALSAIHLANALSREHVVFVCTVRPDLNASEVMDLLSPGVLFLEGSFGHPRWMLAQLHERGWHESEVRLRLLEDLVHFHGIDVIDSRSEPSSALVRRLNRRLKLPCFPHRCRPAAQSPDSIENMGLRARESDPSSCDLDRADARGCWAIEPGLSPGALESFIDPKAPPECEFVVSLGSEATANGWLTKTVTMALQVINRLPDSERGGKRVRFLGKQTHRGRPSRSTTTLRKTSRDQDGAPESYLKRLARCDVIVESELLPAPPSIQLIATLGLQIPIITPDTEAGRAFLSEAHGVAGQLLSNSSRNRLDLDQLITAILRYMKDPTLHAAHRAAAGMIFHSRYAIQGVVERCSAAYRTQVVQINDRPYSLSRNAEGGGLRGPHASPRYPSTSSA